MFNRILAIAAPRAEQGTSPREFTPAPNGGLFGAFLIGSLREIRRQAQMIGCQAPSWARQAAPRIERSTPCVLTTWV